MKAFLIAFLTLLLFAEAGRAQDVVGWQINRYPERGVPQGCMAGANYRDGTRLSIIVTRNYDWGLGLANSSWNLKTGASTTVVAYVDGRIIASGKAAHWARDIAVLPLSGVDAYRALQIGNRLDLQTPHGTLSFALTGTARAMTAVLECARDVRGFEQTQQTPNFQSLSQAEAAVLLANALNAANIRGYVLEPPEPGGVGARFRLADGTRGWLIASRGQGTRSADDYAAVVIGQLSETCKGEFLSGKQSIPSVDGSVVRRVVTTCRAGTNEQVIETTIIRRPSGFLLDLTQFLPPSTGAGVGAKDNDRSTLVDAVMRLPAR
ncbi:MAG TPA: hypothetical protein VNK52_03750 [Hyphomicrobiaceae bacterium]|nr:hypothetical protein [Hyphomicrobiaceae bacterium]